MKLLTDDQSRALVKDGRPVYIDGTKEIPLDAEALIKERDALKVELAFHNSKVVHERFALPPDMIAKTFGKNVSVEDGKLVVHDGGVRVYSRERLGEPAKFDEAIAILAERHPAKDVLLRKPGDALGTAGSPAGPSLPAGTGTMRRADFDRLHDRDKHSYIRGGGVLVD